MGLGEVFLVKELLVFFKKIVYQKGLRSWGMDRLMRRYSTKVNTHVRNRSSMERDRMWGW